MMDQLLIVKSAALLPVAGTRYIVPSLIPHVAVGRHDSRRLNAPSKLFCRTFLTISSQLPTFPDPIRSAHCSLFTARYSLSFQFTMRRSEASACRASEYRGSTSSAS